MRKNSLQAMFVLIEILVFEKIHELSLRCNYIIMFPLLVGIRKKSLTWYIAGNQTTIMVGNLP